MIQQQMLFIRKSFDIPGEFAKDYHDNMKTWSKSSPYDEYVICFGEYQKNN